MRLAGLFFVDLGANDRSPENCNDTDSDDCLARGVRANKRWLKDDAAPPPRMPAETGAADDRRCYDCPRYDHDRASVRPTSAVRYTVKAGAASARGTGVMDAGE